MRGGVLGSPESIKFAVCYCVAQAMMVSFLIASMYRLMTYRISFFDVDVSKIISIRKLWDLVLLKSDAGARQPALDALNALNASASPVSESGLIELYMKTHTQRVHMYSGMFDAHVVFPETIEDVLKESVAAAYPWRLSIDSLDTFVLMYSLLVVCYAILYNNIAEHVAAGVGPKPEEKVSVAVLNGELLLFDLGYWVLMYLVVFISIDCTSSVSISLLTAWAALLYTSSLYTACLPLDIGSVSRILGVAVWCLQTVVITFMTSASLLNGSFLVFMHLFNAIFCYAQLAEGSVSYLKFINMRIWGVVFLNVCLMTTYANNVSFVAARA